MKELCNPENHSPNETSITHAHIFTKSLRIITPTFPYSAGGLVTAVAPVVVETKGLWVGWSGQHQEDGVVEIPEANPNDQSPTAGLKSWQVRLLRFDFHLSIYLF